MFENLSEETKLELMKVLIKLEAAIDKAIYQLDYLESHGHVPAEIH